MSTTTIRQLLENRKGPLLSLEFFPPKDHVGFGVLGGSIERMRHVRPDFVTCTYGAGGASRAFSFAAWELLQKMGFQPVVAHLACIGSSKADLIDLIHHIYDLGIRNIMALRGDPPRNQADFIPAADSLPYAADLVRLIKSLHPDICCGVAGYPETHPQAASPADDIRHLKEKVDAGADFITTQLFFENALYYRYVDACHAAGISTPIIPGLLPAISHKQAQRTVELCNAGFPQPLADRLLAAPDAAAAEAAGLCWLVEQIDDLIANGAPGVHLYILNRAQPLLSPLLMQSLKRWRGV